MTKPKPKTPKPLTLRGVENAIRAFSKALPTVVALKERIAVLLATERRLLAENDDIRCKNIELRRMVVGLQAEVTRLNPRVAMATVDSHSHDGTGRQSKHDR